MSASARRIALSLSVIVAGAGLSGCAQLERTDMAARVNDTVISQEQVSAATTQLHEVEAFAKVTPLQVTQMLGYGVVADPIARKHGVARSVDDMRAAAAAEGTALSGLGPEALEVLRINYLLSQETTKESAFTKDFVAAVKASTVEVNPRIGAVDRSQDGTNLFAARPEPWLKAVSLADKAATGQQ